MPTNRVNLSTTQYVRINLGYGPLIVESLTGDIHIAQSDTKPAATNIAFHKLTDRHRLTFDRLNTNVWALGKNSGAQAVVTETPSEHGDQSTVNSSTELLGVSETFTGVAELNDFPDVGVSCHSSSEGTLYFDFSNDGTNWNTFPVAGFQVAANIHEFHTAVKLGRYFRVRFVNSASAQTYFRLYTYYGQFRAPSAPLNQAIGLDNDAIVARPTWTWMDIARGLQNGISSVKKFGRNDNVGTNYVPVALGGIYRTPQTATALRVKVGGDAQDSSTGTGARSVSITGLDQNFNEVTEIISTNGTSASAPTTTTFTRVYRCFVASSGTYASAGVGSHAAAIVIEDSAGTEDWASIDFNGFPKAQTEIGAYTIPAGKTGFVKLRDISIDSGKTVDAVFFSRRNAAQLAPPYEAMRAQSVVSGVAGGSIESFGSTDVPFGPYVGPTDVGFMAKVGSGTASVSVEFEIILVDE